MRAFQRAASLFPVLIVAVSVHVHAGSQCDMPEELHIEVSGDASLPTLIYLPGLHGDCTLITGFKSAIKERVRFVGFTYPRTLTWNLDDYSAAIQRSLVQRGITNGWLLAESFGSQIAWPIVGNCNTNDCKFRVEGVILAGGFVKHPNMPGVHFARHFSASLPRWCFDLTLAMYKKYATFRHRHAPETLATVNEFIARRTELDRRAMKHRLHLIAANDPRPAVKQVTVPVYALSGFWDPIVPRSLTRNWLKRNCPGYCAAKTIASADHNVLGTEPRLAAEIISAWIKEKGRSEEPAFRVKL